MTADWSCAAFLVLVGVVLGRRAATAKWRQAGIGALKQAKREQAAAEEASWQKGYSAGWEVGRLSKGIAAHITYVVDLPTFHRIKEHEFLHDETPITVPESLSRDARRGTDGE